MAHKNKVMQSLNSPCGLRCVDLFAEGAGQFGWASFRRDPEDGHGWRPEHPGAGGFDSLEAARSAARAEIPWLEDVR